MDFMPPILRRLALTCLSLLPFILPDKAYGQCQNITISLVSTSPSGVSGPGSPLQICQNTTVSVTASVAFESGPAGAIYIWSYGDESPLDTTNALTMTHTYEEGGVYLIDLIVVDTNGCQNSNRLGIPVQVSTTPDFTKSIVIPDTICLNTTTTIHAEAEPVPGIYDCAPPVADTTFLPDGSGVSYTSEITVECFGPNAILTDTSQIVNICLTMEHSYLGDLDWKIICPNNQEMTLKPYPGGGGVYLGEPYDQGTPQDMDPGIGYTYCFAPDAAWGTMLEELDNGNTVPNVGVPPNNSMSPGTYSASGNFNSLIGCPLNGDWTIRVTDHLGIDNGFIMNWNIEFDNSLLPVDHSFMPDFTVEGFLPHPDIINTDNNGHDIEVHPSAPGLQCYTYQVKDNFGCTYDTLLCVYVIDPGNPGADTSIDLCLNIGAVTMMDYLAGNPQAGGLWTGTGITANGSFDPALAGIGQHDLVYTVSNEDCDSSATVTVTVIGEVDIDFTWDLMPGCTEDTVQFHNLSEPGTYLWSYGDGSTPPDDTLRSPLHIFEDQGEYDVRLTVKNRKGCIDSVTKTLQIHHPLSAGFVQSADSLCQADEVVVQFTDTSTGALQWEWDFGDGSPTVNQQHPTHTFLRAGTHQIRLVISDSIPCYDTSYSTIYIDPIPHLELLADKVEICEGEEITFNLDYLEPALQVDWDFGDQIRWTESRQSRHAYDQAGDYVVHVHADYPVCEDLDDTLHINVIAYPAVDLGPDSSICLDGRPVILENRAPESSPLTRWLWNTGDTSARLNVLHHGTYSLTATLGSCSTTEFIEVLKDCYTNLPNAFTPNGDGENDYFYPRQLLTEGVRSFKMTVYNRWGHTVFETSRIDGRGWDGTLNGKEQPVGVYLYQIDVAFKNGRQESYNGNVTLIR